jgi:hypothetical protein
MNIYQPFRVLVSQRGWIHGRTYRGRGAANWGAKSVIEPMIFGFVAWTEDTTAEPRRAGFGSFLFGSIHAARAVILAYLADSRTIQVSVRTNQDRTLFVYHRAADGRVTSYRVETETAGRK